MTTGVNGRPAPAGFEPCAHGADTHAAHWPFGELTPIQAQQRHAFEQAMRADELRGVPSVFGALS